MEVTTPPKHTTTLKQDTNMIKKGENIINHKSIKYRK